MQPTFPSSVFSNEKRNSPNLEMILITFECTVILRAVGGTSG